jgi:S-formylglutathione hydrolase
MLLARCTLPLRSTPAHLPAPRRVAAAFGRPLSSSSVHAAARPLVLRTYSSAAAAMATETAKNKMYGGFNRTFEHPSEACSCTMKFTVFVPPSATAAAKAPVIYYLSGLTCDDSNVIIKSNCQRVAAELGVAIVCPDTSPRPTEEIEGMKDSYDFGIAAGFYLNATQEKWKQWRMYDYITSELPAVLATMPELDLSKQSIMGHSMGGHGALTIGLKNSDKYKSISAFSPITNPVAVPWGVKAFTGYLGEDQSAWK